MKQRAGFTKKTILVISALAFGFGGLLYFNHSNYCHQVYEDYFAIKGDLVKPKHRWPVFSDPFANKCFSGGVLAPSPNR